MKKFHKKLLKFFTLLASAIVAIIFTMLLGWFFSMKISFVIIGFFLFAALLFVVCYFFIESRFYSFVVSLFSPKESFMQDKWWLSITQKPSLLELYKKISGDIRSRIDLEDGGNGISIFLYETKEKCFYNVSPKLESQPVKISPTMLLSYEMEKYSQKILSVGALSSSVEKNPLYKNRYEKLIEELRSLKAEVFIPLRNGKTLQDFVGFILLGLKKNGAPYTIEDIAALGNIARESKAELMYGMMYAVVEERRAKSEAECPIGEKLQKPFFLKKLWFELNKYQKIIGVYFLVMVGYWVALQYSGLKDSFWNYFYSFAYGLVPLIAGFGGCLLSKSLGYLKTVTGRALFSISLGSFFWGAGTMIFAYYNFILHIAVPYPSVADIFYVSGWPFWIYGMINLALATDARINFKKKKFLALFVPIFVMIISYYLLIIIARHGIIFSETQNITKLILDLTYPTVDIIILTFSLLIFSLSSNFRRGVFSFSIPLILFGFIAMYFADFSFSYTTTLAIYSVGDFVDLLFTIGMVFISLGTLGLPLEPSKYPDRVLSQPKKEKTHHNGIFGFADLSFYILKTYISTRFFKEANRPEL